MKQNTIRRNHSGNLIFRECIVQFLRVSIIRVQEELPKRQNVKQNSPGKWNKIPFDEIPMSRLEGKFNFLKNSFYNFYTVRLVTRPGGISRAAKPEKNASEKREKIWSQTFPFPSIIENSFSGNISHYVFPLYAVERNCSDNAEPGKVVWKCARKRRLSFSFRKFRCAIFVSSGSEYTEIEKRRKNNCERRESRKKLPRNRRKTNVNAYGVKTTAKEER